MIDSPLPVKNLFLNVLFLLSFTLSVLPGARAGDCFNDGHGHFICDDNSSNVRIGLSIGLLALIVILSFAAAFWRYRRNKLAQNSRRVTTPFTTPSMSQTYPYAGGFGRSGRGSPFGNAGAGGLSYPARTYGTSQSNAAPEWDPTAGFAPPSMPPPQRRGMTNTMSVPPPSYSPPPAGTFEVPREKEEV